MELGRDRPVGLPLSREGLSWRLSLRDADDAEPKPLWPSVASTNCNSPHAKYFPDLVIELASMSPGVGSASAGSVESFATEQSLYFPTPGAILFRATPSSAPTGVGGQP
ncbi:unnamed protein product [Clonostachys rosea]|uniref:Uncharacterized protein n=1 Tax=Bionectria ochroleuca TaxID=29856 RepID=A0ABY6V5E8_BIOOC|nr:unnamed protein product [Clonostachys rosea]